MYGYGIGGFPEHWLPDDEDGARPESEEVLEELEDEVDRIIAAFQRESMDTPLALGFFRDQLEAVKAIRLRLERYTESLGSGSFKRTMEEEPWKRK